MSALSVLDALDRQIGNNYNAAPSYEQLQEARAAVAELIEQAATLARYAEHFGNPMLTGNRCWPTAKKWTNAEVKEIFLAQGRRVSDALARVGGAA